MKSLLNQPDRDEVVKRLYHLSPASSRRWGTMTVNQAIVHVTDPLRDALEERQTKQVMPRLLSILVKPIVLSKKPFKPGTATPRPYDQVKGHGTRPTSFNQDMTELIDRIHRFSELSHDERYGIHPALGRLTGDEWGRLLYKEIDHHLRQFGV